MTATGVDSSVYLDRLARVRAAMAEQDVDTLLLSVGHDLPYLTGYTAMPLERLTMLVVPRDAGATMLIPALEAPRVRDVPGAFDLLPWGETQDPTAIVARLEKPWPPECGAGPTRIGTSTTERARSINSGLIMRRRSPSAASPSTTTESIARMPQPMSATARGTTRRTYALSIVEAARRQSGLRSR